MTAVADPKSLKSKTKAPYKSLKTSQFKTRKSLKIKKSNKVAHPTNSPSKRHGKSNTLHQSKAPSLFHGTNKSIKPTSAVVNHFTPSPFFSSKTSTNPPSWITTDLTTYPTIQHFAAYTEKPSHGRMTPSSLPTSPYLNNLITPTPSIEPSDGKVNHLTPTPSSYTPRSVSPRYSTSPSLYSFPYTTLKPSDSTSRHFTIQPTFVSTINPIAQHNAVSAKPSVPSIATFTPSSSMPTHYKQLSQAISLAPSIKPSVTIVIASTPSPSHHTAESSSPHRSTEPSVTVYPSPSLVSSVLPSAKPSGERFPSVAPSVHLKSTPSVLPSNVDLSTPTPKYTTTTQSAAGSTSKPTGQDTGSSSVHHVPRSMNPSTPVERRFVTYIPSIKPSFAIVYKTPPSSSLSSTSPSVRSHSSSTVAPSSSIAYTSSTQPSHKFSSKPAESTTVKSTVVPTSSSSRLISSVPSISSSEILLDPSSKNPIAAPSQSPSPSTLLAPTTKPSTGFGSDSHSRNTRKPSYSSSMSSSASPTVEPILTLINTNQCIVSDQGNFGNVSINNTSIFIDYKYELTTNLTVMNNSKISLAMVTVALEKTVSSLLLPLLFHSCDNSTKLPSLRTRRLESVDVLGISSTPQDIITLGKFFISV